MRIRSRPKHPNLFNKGDIIIIRGQRFFVMKNFNVSAGDIKLKLKLINDNGGTINSTYLVHT